MPLSLSKIEHEITESPIRKITNLLMEAAADPDIISFGGGAPSLPPHPEVVNAMTKALKEDTFNACRYGSTWGRKTIRELISTDLKKYGKLDFGLDQIAVTTGATGGIFLALEDLVNPGDHVIVPDPTYVGYPGPTVIDRAKLKRVPVYVDDDFQLTPEGVAEVISKKSKVIILLTPDNPTGRVLKKENLRGIAELAADHNCWILSDETYKDIVYGKKHEFVAKYAPENTITACTFSKSASIPGLRCGYVYGPKEAINGIIKFNQFVSLAPNTLSQIGAEAFFPIKETYVNKTVIPTYKKRRDQMAKSLKKHLPEAKFTMPEGAFYFFVDMSAYIKEDEKFANNLLENKKVILIPGKYFGEKGKLHERFTFVSETVDRIEEGIKRIADYLS